MFLNVSREEAKMYIGLHRGALHGVVKMEELNKFLEELNMLKIL